MPYINKESRDRIIYRGATPKVPGELNYIVSATVDQYIKDCGLSYTTLNEIIGVLECAKMELYRRIAAPYEDQKLLENGEVYLSAMSLIPLPEGHTRASSIQLDLFLKPEQAILTGEAKYGETKFN